MANDNGNLMQNESEIARPLRAKGVQRWAGLDDVEGVYVIGFGPHAKIGRSGRVGYRLRSIEEYTPEALKVYWVLGTPFGPEIEGGLHRRFKSLRVRREWFKFEGALAEFVQPAIASGLNDDPYGSFEHIGRRPDDYDPEDDW